MLNADAMPENNVKKIYPWQRHLLLCAPLFLAVLVCAFSRGWSAYADFAAFTALRDSHPGLTLLMRACSNLIYPLCIAFWLAMLFLALLRQDREQRLFMLRYIILVLVVGVALPQLLKHVLGMPRPGVLGSSPGFPPPDAFKSFPSGHTAATVALALPLALRYPTKAIQICAAVGMAMVGYSRIWLLRHHPVDIFAGLLVGSLVSWLAWQGTAALPKFSGKNLFP